MRYAPDPLEQFVYSTQLMQAEASRQRLPPLEAPVERPRPGVLRRSARVADQRLLARDQLVDCRLLPAPEACLLHGEAEMAPVSIGITRREHKHPRDKYTRVNIDVRTQIEIWGSNLMLEDLTVDCVLKAWDVETGKETFSKTVAAGLLLPENRSTEIVALDVPVSSANAGEEARTVVAAYLIKGGKQIARYVNWPEPLKYLHLQKPKELSAVLSQDGKVVEISAEVPVKGVALESEDDAVRFEDNLVDIVPGEVVTIGVRGASESTKIETRYLGMLWRNTDLTRRQAWGRIHSSVDKTTRLDALGVEEMEVIYFKPFFIWLNPT